MNKEYIDGFLLGDGCLSIDKRFKRNIARATCSVEHKEFCEYLMNPFEDYHISVNKYESKNMKQGYVFSGRTQYHIDFFEQCLRWYKYKDGKRYKSVPTDVSITPISVMMWYLGDGSVTQPNEGKRIMVRFSTDGFLKEEVEFLSERMRSIGIKAHRDNDNRIQIDARGIPAFFDFIGRTSPVKCYDYKFNLPTWRLESKRMKDVANELKIDYNRLCYFVKIGRINCYRLSEQGRPRFLPEHINKCRKLIESGELY